MIRTKGKSVPDAWDDDEWETKADLAAKEPPKKEPTPVLSKPERMMLHRESNRKLWESADSPEPFHFLHTSNPVPLATNFKPQVKVLSRKPTPPRDPVTGLADLSLRDGSDDEEEAVRKHKIEAAARMLESKRLQEEKQKAYEEARRRIFGEEKEDSGRGQAQAQRGSGRGRGNRGNGNGRGRGRGGAGRGNDGRSSDASRSAASSRSATPLGRGPTKELFDPNYSPKPSSILPKGDGSQGRRNPTKDDNTQAAPVREPRGPDGSGRGGFGFARGRGK
ncbi:uncharacterized protein DNG_00332 [Cephalotrichum gorgonifer]|uniref:SUZ domain-containing protein n=1 Tax=Cephalotrichum gorgonifer TaxID=2041049 RepID=A0AAE8SR35_9PEZI|nr:uncharacterized protein DNG_00332 [Cephalotrichum gorgonifer]